MIKENTRTLQIPENLGFPSVVLTIDEARTLNRVLTEFLSHKDFPLSPDRYEVVTGIDKLKVGDTIYTYCGNRSYDLIVEIGPYQLKPSSGEGYRVAKVLSFFVEDFEPDKCGLQLQECWLTYDGSANQLAHDDGFHIVKDY
jgi:hypothetical protein